MLRKALQIINKLFPAEISPSECQILITMDETAIPLIDKLWKSRRISAKEFYILRNAVDKEQEARRKKKAKAVLRGVDRDLSRRGSPEVQGGLPSLGKRKP